MSQPKSSEINVHSTLNVTKLEARFKHNNNKMFSYRRDRAAGYVIVLAKSGRLELGDIFYGHYRSIFNHCDILGLKIYRIQ